MASKKYDKDEDYKALMNALSSSGDLQGAAEAEELRNAKIEGEGMKTQAKSYLFARDPNDPDGDTAASRSQANAIMQGGQGASAGGLTYETAPAYLNKYSDQIKALTDKLLSGNYSDFKNGGEYAALKDSYTANGERAMLDTVGQISSRTGGLASSYATTAGQQSYNNHMTALEQAAMEMYGQENDRTARNVQLLQALENGDYVKYQNLLSQYNSDRDFSYRAGRDEIADDRYGNEWQYGVGRDEVADGRYEDEWQYGVGRDEVSDKRYEDETAYNRKLQAAAAQLAQTRTNSGRGGGKGGGAATGGEQDYEGLFAAATESGNPKSFLSNNYKKFGFRSATGLYDDYINQSKNLKNGDRLGYSEDEGIFTWNGKEYNSPDALVQEMDAAKLSAAQKKKLTEKFRLYGFEIQFD